MDTLKSQYKGVPVPKLKNTMNINVGGFPHSVGVLPDGKIILIDNIEKPIVFDGLDRLREYLKR